MLVTGDESWFVPEYQHSTKWNVARDEVPTSVSQTIRMKKVMLTVIWGIDGFHVIDMMPCHPGSFCHRVLPYSYYGFFAGKSLSGGKEKPSTSPECAPGQLSGLFFEGIKTVFDGNSLVTIPYPPYSPNLAPSDFWLFGHIKTSLVGRVFNDADELLEAVIEFVNEIQPSESQLVSHQWIERVKWVLANNRD
jgi:hypothetical protein